MAKATKAATTESLAKGSRIKASVDEAHYI